MPSSSDRLDAIRSRWTFPSISESVRHNHSSISDGGAGMAQSFDENRARQGRVPGVGTLGFFAWNSPASKSAESQCQRLSAIGSPPRCTPSKSRRLSPARYGAQDLIHRLLGQGGVFEITVGVRAANVAEAGLTADGPFEGAIRRWLPSLETWAGHSGHRAFTCRSQKLIFRRKKRSLLYSPVPS